MVGGFGMAAAAGTSVGRCARREDVAPPGEPFTLAYQGRTLRVSPAGTVRTGAGEDSRVYLSMPEFQAWTGLQPSVVEIAAYGSVAEVNSLLSSLRRDLPGTDVHPVRQVTRRRVQHFGEDALNAIVVGNIYYLHGGTVRAGYTHGMDIRSAPRFCHHEGHWRL